MTTGGMQMRYRSRWIIAILIVGFIACFLRLGWLQIVRGPALAQAAENARVSVIHLPAKRGDIVDSAGTVLATSVQTYDLYMSRHDLKQYKHCVFRDASGHEISATEAQRQGRKCTIEGYGAPEAARVLAPVLKKQPAELGGQIAGDDGSVIIATNVSVKTWRQIKKLGITGLDAVPSYQREYPNAQTASTILGFTALAGDGAPGNPLMGKAGIEQTQNKVLTGKDGIRRIEISPYGQTIPGGYSEETPARDGDQVKLTINADLQTLAQQEIDKAVQEHQAEWGTAIALDVKTGAVLALADSGEVSPADVRAGKAPTWGSRAVQYTYEPGSTGKLVTFATGLSEKKFTPLTPVTVPYQITMKHNQSFKDSHEHGTLHLTAAGVLAESSNTGTVQLGDLVTDKDRWNMMRALGLGAKTGIEMPGEASGNIGTPEKWDGRQRYTTMFGQGMATSPLQVTSMVATIANSGVREPVHIIDSYRSPTGAVTKATHVTPKQVLDPDTASTLLKMMEAVTTDEGTARAAQVPGYHTAGKTGTTQILSPSGRDAGAVSSFVGVLPAEDPRVAISVVIYKPTRGAIWGGTVAGPVFATLGASTMALFDVPPSTKEQTLYPQKTQ
ncbi:MAG: penicillin-binding protein 2 [Actinomycetaceae bacterium]|nr:penicillin-binding protein 2 [Actinomycetaceae bacterium]MDU0970037.1 penicillin-binding protein 2 [Actinomycetaceae bacterium]